MYNNNNNNTENLHSNGSGPALSLLFDALPLQAQTSKEGSSCASNRDVEGMPQTIHVRL